ncbi:MAG TPA: MJ0042-type zinc finger domain-containing protein [Thermoanaerobaculia bacterium]|nr:MJ0042-type zinc finger domain-containing protein [Thermoanaerobaculia bacterium]
MEAEQRYNFTCPNCSGSFSIQIDRIPPVQARFRCPHCKEPMDFPSREEARAYVRLQAEAGGAVAASSAPSPARKDRASGETPPAGDSTGGADSVRFRVEKPGFQTDVFDRRGLRNLIRTGEVLETDRVRVDDSAAVPAGDLPYLVSLFKMAKEQRAKPPACCRTHTERVAFFRCNDTRRPLCEKCAPEKKFGGQTIRVCQHCGGTAVDLMA